MAFLGLRGTGDWQGDQRPKDWRESILRLMPNGDAPLTAITAKLGKEVTIDPEFNWWEDELPSQAASLNSTQGVFSNSAMDSAYTETGDRTNHNGTVYLKLATAADYQRFRDDIVIRLTDTSNPDLSVVAHITDVESGKITAKLLMPEGTNVNGADIYSDTGLANADRIMIVGSAQAEGVGMPEAINQNPSKYHNYTQIFEYPLEMTRTAKKTKLRTEEQYQRSKREALEQYSRMIEKAYIWGVPFETTGSNGKPLRYSGGIMHYLRKGAPDNIQDYEGSCSLSWAAAGEDWLDEVLETIFAYGSDEKLALVGSSVMTAVSKLAKSNANIQLVPGKQDYGINVVKYHHSHGILYLKRHPLFSIEPTMKRAALIIEPKYISRRHLEGDDTRFKKDPQGADFSQGGEHSKDKLKESYISEEGLVVAGVKSMGLLRGFGIDNNEVA